MAASFKEFRAVTDEKANEQQAESVQPDREPGVNQEREPGNTPDVPEAERPPERKEGVVSDPDFAARR
jgi:hypothetical protein